MVEFDTSDVFGDFQLIAIRRYEDHTAELCEMERRIEAYEARTRRLVAGFEAYQAATGDDNEARFVRWEICREKADRRLHKRRTGLY